MKIKTWIKYEESYIPPRCRKPHYNECEEYVNINLSETTMSALQLAFEDNSYDGVGKIFFYKGKLWTKSSIRDIWFGGESMEAAISVSDLIVSTMEEIPVGRLF